ncbi:hypothetical protein [Sphingomonas sp. 3-13AW]|uniref:hypothetical protein n=1 Tax=Sphingomonas sp. 3-13AW TaxID=3050450 RepID=UPI003BB65CEF
MLDDLDEATPDQVMALATAVADFLIRSGQIKDDVALSGPDMLQFLSEAADMASSADKTVQIVGLVELEHSKRMLRYATVFASEPYAHEASIQIVGKPDQTEDTFYEELERRIQVPVSITARNEGGHLVCTTDDILPARGAARTDGDTPCT